jgi:hypothetical protein
VWHSTGGGVLTQRAQARYAGGGADAARRVRASTGRGARGTGRHWRGQERQEETPSDSRLGAREGVAVDRVQRGGTDDQKRNPTRSRLKRGVGVGGTRQGGVAGINKVSCIFHVTLFGCVGQLRRGSGLMEENYVSRADLFAHLILRFHLAPRNTVEY